MQLQLTACPFGLLLSFGDAESSKKAAVLSSIPQKLRRRVFVLTAQFFELMKDIHDMTQMLGGARGHLSKGRKTENTKSNIYETCCTHGSFGVKSPHGSIVKGVVPQRKITTQEAVLARVSLYAEYDTR